MNNIIRRFFIKSSSLVAGGLVLPSFNINRMANSSNNKKLKVSVVGCGGRGTGAAVQALNADDKVELYAVADVFRDRIDSSIKAINGIINNAYGGITGEMHLKIDWKIV